MKRILCIGNSFGSDCTRYLWGVARADGVNIKVVNLYIGGCSLYRHYRNMLSEEPVYNYEINGFRTDLMVSLKQILLMEEWDVIFTQQCSPESGEDGSYLPFDVELAAYVRKCCPRAKFFVHQTWTFEEGAPRFKLTSYDNPVDMIEAIRRNYFRMYEETSADGFIPDGEAMYRMWQRKAEIGLEAVHRDGFHADYGVGRYLLALTVWRSITGRSVKENSFRDFDVAVTEEQAAAAREIAEEVCDEYEKLLSEGRGE